MKNSLVKGIGNFQGFNEYLNTLAMQMAGPCLGLAQGEPGKGKTRTCLALTAQNPERYFYLRAHPEWSPCWMIGDILQEFSVHPERGLERRVKQLNEVLTTRGRVLILVDEGDIIAPRPKLIQTLRYSFDLTGVPIVLVGLPTTERYLRNSGPYLDRIASIFTFENLSIEDVALFIAEKSEIPFDPDTARTVAGLVGKRLRALERFIMSIENMARVNSWKLIDQEKLQAWQRATKRSQVQTEGRK